jgi:hypothetical protein
MGKVRGPVVTLALLALVVLAIGCGEDSGSESDETEAKTQRLYPRVHGPSREFLIPGGDNIVQFFGQEAPPAEREDASKVVHAWMQARVAKDWAEDCKFLTRAYAKNLAADAHAVSKGKVENCPQALAFFGPNASGSSGNTLTGPIDSLRMRDTIAGSTEKEAYAQYHGRKGIDWIVPMAREKGTWKVATASPLERTK